MPEYRNATEARRVWPDLQRPDGRTVELDPDEHVTLDHEVDAYGLEPVGAFQPAPAPPVDTAPEPSTPEE